MIDDEILEWHEKTFPKADIKSQLLKLDEELKEVVDAQRNGEKEKSYDELADVYIVSLVLEKRFKSTIGAYFIGLLQEYPAPESMKRVKNKMKINKKRTWHEENGVYRHDEE
jgi:hypothetical protein